MTLDLPRTPGANACRLSRFVEPLARAAAGQVVFLVDGDRTLSPRDTSRDLLARAGLDHLPIKRRFQREGYVFSAFRFHAEVHLSVAEERFDLLCQQVAAQAVLHPGALAFVRCAALRGQVYIVSSGIPRIWSYVMARHDIDGVGVIGGIDPRLPFVFGRWEKGQVAAAFQSFASSVVAVGDSDVDADMLRRADHAVVVVNHRQNADLIPALTGHASLWQVVPQGVPHPGIPTLAFPAIAQLDSSAVSSLSEMHACL